MAFEELKPGSFIYRVRNALDAGFCDEVVCRFEAQSDEHYAGRIGHGASQQDGIKKSVDLRITGKAHWQDVDSRLFESLSGALGGIGGLHPYFASNAFKDMGYNLQRYRSGEYYHWHVDSGPGSFSQRQLVAIWYLNDVSGPGGATEFAFQDVAVSPIRGDLLLFPPFWTHVHRSAVLEQGVKYIATTWVCFA